MLLAFAVLMGGLRLAAQAQPEQATQAGSGQDVGNNQASATQPLPSGLVHIVPFGRNASPIKNTFAPSGAHLTYFGGPVISQVHVVAVFWGANVDPAITTPGAIDQFFRDITSSRYYDLLTEYGTAGVTSPTGASSNQSINRGVFDNAFTITPSVCNVTPPATCNVDDTQIRTELTSQIAAGHLPQPVSGPAGDIETFYMIYFPPGVTITSGSLVSCVQGGFCAYHSNVPTTLVPYGVLPDFTGACSTGCGSGTLFQRVTAVTSHELSEAVTDPQIGSAKSTTPPLAWFDPNPAISPLGEIGDICTGLESGVTAGLNNYVVQTEFSNLQNDCVSAPPNLVLTPPASVGPGAPFNLTLTIRSSSTGSIASAYTGTVHFTSPDPTAVLPADYTFTATDAGTHTFTGVSLSTLGDQTINVADTHSAGFTGSATTNVNTIPDLAISKTHVGDFTAGQTGSYTIVVSNPGNGPTTAPVTVTDTLPSGLTATAISGTGWTCDPATLTCTRADALARGNSYPAITLTVNVAANAPFTVLNSVAVSGGGETNSANDTASDFATILEPDLAIDKHHSIFFFVGQTGATYTITVTNFGTLPTTGDPVTVVDTLPAGLNATAISGTGWACTLATLTCTRSDVLAAFGISYPPITVTVDVTLTAPGTVINIATVSGGGDPTPGNNVAPDVTSIGPPPAPDLSVAMTDLGNFLQGQTGTYVINVTNVGNGATTAPVSVADTLPASLSATSISGTGWTCDLPTLTCARSDVLGPTGSSYPPIGLNVNIAANAPATVTNTATVSGGGDTTTFNNSVSRATLVTAAVVDLQPGLFLHPSSYLLGQSNASYTVRVFNSGNLSSSGVVSVSNTLPADLTPTAIGGPGWTCTLATLSCDRSDALAAGSFYPDITVTFNIAINASSTVTVATAVSGGGDASPGNNTTGSSLSIGPIVNILSTTTPGISIAAGQPKTFTADVHLSSAAGTVSFSCSGLPTGAACSFAPLSITQSGSIAMLVTTTSRLAAWGWWTRPPTGNTPMLLAVMLSLTGVVVSGLVRSVRWKRLRLALAIPGLLLLAVVVAGCGGGSASSGSRVNPNGTPAGTYSITMTAVGSSAGSASQVFTLTVR